MSSTWTSTHPLNSYQPSYISVKEFKETLEDALRNYYGYSLCAHYYRSVCVLLVFWEIDKDDRLKIGNFVDRLDDVFTRSYSYKVNKLGFQIQDPSPQESLMEVLRSQMHNIDNNDLTIVYYVCHGKMEGNDLQIYATEYPKVNFSAVRRLIIDNAATNVLVLLDCCYAGGGAIGVNKEIIAASAGDQVAYNGGTASFSSNLIQQLQHTAATKQILTSPQLYARLATKALVRNADGTAELGSTPVHIQKYQIYRCPIYLAPVTSVEDWSAPEQSFIFSQPVNVLLSVHLRDGLIKTLQELREWLSRSRPSGVLRVHFCDIFLAGSATLIFEVTLDVWDNLPDHPAISFISFKQNTHLPLPLPQQTKPKSPEKEPVHFAKYKGDDSPFAKLLKEDKKPGD
jgi:hypothetical protein